MIGKGNSYRILMKILTIVLIQILHEGECSIIKMQGHAIMNNTTNQNQNQSLHQYYYRSSLNYTNIETTEDNDPDYPYDEILQLVKDTKRIMMSSNETEKNQLNLDPEIYTRYLLGDLSDTVSYAGVPYPPTVDPCPYKIEYRSSKKLIDEDNEQYYIINVENELRQQYHAVVCSEPGSRCRYDGLPDQYAYFCRTSFNRKRSFVSIPVGNKISLSQQRFRSFDVPDGCICSGLRDT